MAAKRENKMPPFPPGWDKKFTGPAYVEGESFASARAKWYRFCREARKLRPCPPQTRGPKPKK